MPRHARLRPLAVAALALAVTLAAPTTAQAASGHPAPAPAAAAHPTARTAAARLAVDESAVPRASVTAFGGGTVFAPRGTGSRTLGAVIVTPGFTQDRSVMRWYGLDLAARGYVVLTIDTLDPMDFPDQRSAQMLAAADYLTGSSAVKDRVDPDRVAVLGYSMGAGGALEAAEARPALKAAVAFMPFDIPPASRPDATTRTYPGITTPTLIITGQDDQVADPATMGKPFYESIPASTPKRYLELRDAAHPVGSRTRNLVILDAVTRFLARYLDGDTSAATAICPAPAVTVPISGSASSCGPTAG